MLEELFESALGPIGIGIVLLLSLPNGRRAARGGIKMIMRKGIEITDYLKEIKEEVEDERNFYAKGKITDKSRA
ncbi:MAG: hypothetical protein ACRD3W_04820 [Terriglobales bacterium]